MALGEQIVPGVYEAANVSGQCEWARLSRLDDSGEDIIFSDTTFAPASVSIFPTDVGFRASEACGHWTAWVPPTATPHLHPNANLHAYVYPDAVSLSPAKLPRARPTHDAHRRLSAHLRTAPRWLARLLGTQRARPGVAT